MRWAVVVLGALALAGLATAASKRGFAPRLRVEQGRFDPAAGANVVLDVSQRLDERPMRRIVFVVPPEARFTVPRSGTVGDAAVVVVPARGRSSTFVGKVTAGGVTGSCVRGATAALSASLLSPRTPAKVYLLFDVYEVGGSKRVAVCPPALEAGEIRRLVFRLERGFSAPRAGRTVWRALFTPAGAGRAATIESRGIVVSPSFLTLEALGSSDALRAGSRLRLRGSLAMPGLQAHRWIRLLAGRDAGSLELVAHTRTTATGKFAIAMKVPAGRGHLIVQARARSLVVPCHGREPDAPAGCGHATAGGASSTVLSFVVR